MSSNGVTIAEDADMAECDGEKVVTMMDVLQEQQDFEEDANAVLGASDEKNCTFLKGYIKRQALYACLTCCSDARTDPTKRAGVCLACSLNCHENHELIELYTKRNFRCDCGNPKFNRHPCQYTPDKPDLNEENSYNQNFSGLYCTCHRPYPDSEATFEDEMIQCIICEDWLHAAHLEANLPPNEQYAEMICKACMEKNEFLHDYSEVAVNNETAEVDVTSVNNETPAADKSSENETPKVNGVLESSEVCDEKETKMGTDVEMTETENEKSNIELTTENEGKQIVNNTEPTVPTTENGVENIDDKESTVPDATDENKIDKEVSDTTDTTKEEDNVQQPSEKETENEKQIETAASAANNDPKIDSITNDAACESTVEHNETKDEESVENKGAANSEENKMETNAVENASDKNESNENSIIESIEKLENELGNVEPKDKSEEKEQTTTNDSSNNDNNKTESKEEDSINTNTAPNKEESDSKVDEPSQENKQEITEPELKTNDVEINEENEDKANGENDTSNNEKSETTENVQNGTIEDKVSKPSDETSNELEAKTDETTKESKRKLSIEEPDEVSMKKPKLDETSSCCRPKGVKRIFKGATFWPSNFRQKLCTCNECISMYKDLSVLFLTDPEDTVTAYEALGKQRTDGSASSQYERGLEALSSLDRIQQINALTEYNKMRDKLLDFLKSFKDRKEVVKEEDIKAFFAGMKPKREPDGVYFCR
ncbi:hypothetical protein ABMA28_002425 [Loxostege sticticalis]|uniref:UBR-type domain-containing protein n=1 Tax=Loxostege sticticalis TaxID=481309 RepID=A0ABD0T3K4_LOXSC